MSIRRELAAIGLLGFGFMFSGCCGVSSCGSSCGGGVLPNRLANRMVNQIANPCQQGCGEIYWGEQTNYPPVCDPCCGRGEFTGVSCGECKPLLTRLRQAWGLPYVGPCECATPGCDGCDSCDGGGEAFLANGVPHGDGHHCPSCAAEGAPPVEYYEGGMESVPAQPMPAQPIPQEAAPSQAAPAQEPTAAAVRRRPGQPTPARARPAATRSAITR